MIIACPSCSAVKRVEKVSDSDVFVCDDCRQTFSGKSSQAARVTLTKSQLRIPEVSEFAELLINIASDGAIEYEELQNLAEWLNAHKSIDVPAIHFMFNLLLRVCKTQQLGGEEIYQVQLGIERVLPKEFRTRIVEKRLDVHYSAPATERQLDLIQQITFNRPTGLSKREASEMIERIFEGPTNRQKMFMRFCNRIDMLDKTREQVSQWMDDYIQTNPSHWEAWQVFKSDIQDDGGQNNPEMVTVGVIQKYLARQKPEKFFDIGTLVNRIMEH